MITHTCSFDEMAIQHDPKCPACKAEQAAPEMLEALELAQATIERVNPKVHNSCSGTLDVIRAVIAKAGGKG